MIANGKGGCGKTNISVHLAAALARLSSMASSPLYGMDVTLVDHDTQRSASDWHRARSAASFHKILPVITLAEPSGLKTLNLAGTDNLYVHDLAAGAMPLSGSDIQLSNALLFMPVLPCAADIKALFRYSMKLNRRGAMEGYAGVALIANRVKRNCESSDLLEHFMAAQELMSITSISHSEVYVRAMSTGITCFDHPLKVNALHRAQWAPLLQYVEQQAVSINNSSSRSESTDVDLHEAPAA